MTVSGVTDNRGLFSTAGRVRRTWWMVRSLALFSTPLSSPVSGDLSWCGGRTGQTVGWGGWGLTRLTVMKQRSFFIFKFEISIHLECNIHLIVILSFHFIVFWSVSALVYYQLQKISFFHYIYIYFTIVVSGNLQMQLLQQQSAWETSSTQFKLNAVFHLCLGCLGALNVQI